LNVVSGATSIKFNAPIPLAKQREIAEVLVPLAAAGFSVRVAVPDEGGDGLARRVLIDAPGRTPRPHADAAVWAEVVTQGGALQASSGAPWAGRIVRST
jgi:hypothetical protein